MRQRSWLRFLGSAPDWVALGVEGEANKRAEGKSEDTYVVGERLEASPDEREADGSAIVRSGGELPLLMLRFRREGVTATDEEADDEDEGARTVYGRAGSMLTDGTVTGAASAVDIVWFMASGRAGGASEQASKRATGAVGCEDGVSRRMQGLERSRWACGRKRVPLRAGLLVREGEAAAATSERAGSRRAQRAAAAGDGDSDGGRFGAEHSLAQRTQRVALVGERRRGQRGRNEGSVRRPAD